MDSAWGVLESVGLKLGLHDRPGRTNTASWHEGLDMSFVPLSHLLVKLFLGLTMEKWYQELQSSYY